MLHGEHVVLRPLRDDDFVAWYTMMAYDVQNSLLGAGDWVPLTAEAARARFQGLLHTPPDERISFAIDLDGACIGTMALKDIDRRSQHAWLAIVLDGSQQGRGYGRDAIRTLLEWAFDIQNFRRISLETWATNERALRCYLAVGFIEEGRMREVIWVDRGYVDVVQMGVLRSEWRARQKQP